MEYKELVKDFVYRTKVNLELIRQAVNDKKEAAVNDEKKLMKSPSLLILCLA